MPPSRKLSTIDLSTTAIEQFIQHKEANNKGSSIKRMNLVKNQNVSQRFNVKESCLNQIIYYFMCSKELSEGCLVGDAKEVTNLKNLCDASLPVARSQFLTALTTYCANYFTEAVDLNKIIDDNLPVGKIVAAFHKASTDHIRLDLDINKLANLSDAKRAVILFCIKRFVPELVISGNFINASKELTLLNDIINSFTVTTSLTYKDCKLYKMNKEEMTAFRASLTKAHSLVLDGESLDKWGEENLDMLVLSIRDNPQIKVLSLAHTHLDECCAVPKEFKLLLELITLKQFTKINLHGNHLSSLPPQQLEKLTAAIQTTKAGTVKLNLKQNKKVTASELGLFSDTKPTSMPSPAPAAAALP